MSPAEVRPTTRRAYTNQWTVRKGECTAPMAPYTRDELEAMLADLESDLVERKESLQGDNPRRILAEAMRVIGLAQRYGAGIPTARRALLANGQPAPDFRVEPNWIHCTVRARSR